MGEYKQYKKGKHLLYEGDCLDVLNNFIENNKKVDLIITDPPYNAGLNYHVYNDRKTLDEYINYIAERLNLMADVLSENGSLYFINYPELNARFLPLIEDKLLFRRWITWHYPTNIGHSKNNWTRSQRSILFFTKSNKNIFNKDDIAQAYKNPNVTKVKKRIEAGSKGRAPYDFLEVSDLEEILNEPSDTLTINLLKNVCKDRIENHPCQLPSQLVKVLIKASSNEADTIFDPFAGTFMVSLIAKELNRKSIGIEINPDYVKIGLERLKNG